MGQPHSKSQRNIRYKNNLILCMLPCWEILHGSILTPDWAMDLAKGPETFYFATKPDEVLGEFYHYLSVITCPCAAGLYHTEIHAKLEVDILSQTGWDLLLMNLPCIFLFLWCLGWRRKLQGHSLTCTRWELHDEGLCPDDSLPGILGSCQTLCQPQTSGQSPRRVTRICSE